MYLEKSVWGKKNVNNYNADQILDLNHIAVSLLT